MNTMDIFTHVIFFIAAVLTKVVAIQNKTDCLKRIYRDCLVASYTEQELNTAIDYIQTRFRLTNPSKRACSRSEFRVRKEIRCLTSEEFADLIDAWKQLYADGTVDQFTELHVQHWAAEHKFSEATRAHYEFINQFERKLRAINANISMPYWNFNRDFAHPELSKIWELFGHSGTADNDFCVPDGPFANIRVNYPTPHCLRRQWRPDGTLWPWKSPEYLTVAEQMLLNRPLLLANLQTGANQFASNVSELLSSLITTSPSLAYAFSPSRTPYTQMTTLSAVISHFDAHLSIGGWAGDMSVKYAPNDPLFLVFHMYGELFELKWQLSNSDNTYLVPISYNFGRRYNASNGQTYATNIDTDRLFMFPAVTVKETFQFGFGDRCYIYDELIKPINAIVKRGALPVDRSRPLPSVARRLKESMSARDFRRYFPKFATNAWTEFDHTFTEFANSCNAASPTCARMPRAPHFSDTAEGRRQFELFGDLSEGGLNTEPIVVTGERIYDSFMNALSNYCSPYAVQP